MFVFAGARGSTNRKPTAAPAVSTSSLLSVLLLYPGSEAVFFFFFRTHLLFSFWTSRGHRCRPFSPPALAFNFIAHRAQQSNCSSIFHRVLLTCSASQFVSKKKSPRIHTSMHSGGFELTKLTYHTIYQARGYLNLIRHRGDRL